MVSKLLKSHGVKQLLGACAGMLVASVLYVGLSMLPTGHVTKALLVDTNSNMTDNADRVRINDKTVTDGELARIANRAAQVAAQIHAAAGEASGESSYESSKEQASASQSPIEDRVDPNAWMAMRETRRQLATLHDAASSSAVSVQSSEMSSVSSSQYAEVEYTAPVPTMTETSDHLPNSGLGLNVLIVAAFLLSMLGLSTVRRRTLIAALRQAH